MFDYPALEAILGEMRTAGAVVDAVWVLGDLVEGKLNHRGQYYTAFPLEVQRCLAVQVLSHIMESVGARELYIIPGNHDRKHGIDLIREVVQALDEMYPDTVVYFDRDVVDFLDEDAGIRMLLLHGVGRTAGSDYLGLTPLIISNIMSIPEAAESDLIVLGHYHKSVLLPYARKWILALPSFQAGGRPLRDERIVYVVSAGTPAGLELAAYTATPTPRHKLTRYWSERIRLPG